MDDFHALTGTGIGIIDLKGNVLVATGWQDICVRYHRAHPETLQHCLQSDYELTRGIPPGTFKEYKCRNRMWDIATPIVIESRHLGNIFLGQFFYDDDVVDREAFRAQARQYGFDEAEYLAALDRVPRWNRERVATVMRFYTGFASLISQLSYSNLLLSRAVAERERLLEAEKKQEERFRIISDYTVNWESWFAPDGKYIWVNPGAEPITGYTPGEILGMDNFIDHLIPEEDRESVTARFREALATRRGENQEIRFIRKDGAVRWLNVAWQAIRDDSGTFLGIRASGNDITEKKEGEAALERAVAEKELLLRELRHRVKNSLSIVSSLLSLDQDLVQDEFVSERFRVAIGRIKSISAIYEQLNGSESFESVCLRQYLEKLIAMIRDSFSLPDDRIVFADRTEDSRLALRIAVPVGLILNELITNAIKYAYPENGAGQGVGEIRVVLDRDGMRYRLSVEDDGKGLPEGFKPEEASGLGLRISGMLAQQIGGTLSYDGAERGTRATVEF